MTLRGRSKYAPETGTPPEVLAPVVTALISEPADGGIRQNVQCQALSTTCSEKLAPKELKVSVMQCAVTFNGTQFSRWLDILTNKRFLPVQFAENTDGIGNRDQKAVWRPWSKIQVRCPSHTGT